MVSWEWFQVMFNVVLLGYLGTGWKLTWNIIALFTAAHGYPQSLGTLGSSSLLRRAPQQQQQLRVIPQQQRQQPRKQPIQQQRQPQRPTQNRRQPARNTNRGGGGDRSGSSGGRGGGSGRGSGAGGRANCNCPPGPPGPPGPAGAKGNNRYVNYSVSWLVPTFSFRTHDNSYFINQNTC